MNIKIRIVSLVISIAVLATCLYGCASSSETANQTGSEETKLSDEGSAAFFEWEDSTIVGLTEKGKKQKKLVIPDNCTAIDTVFVDAEATSVEFEDDDDLFFGTAFMGMADLKEISLPKNLTKLDSMSFESCTSLEKITIPEGIETIDAYSFSNCGSLTDIEFTGEQVKEILDSAFSYCKSIKTVTLPNGVTTIGENAFLGCSSLTTVYLPATIKKIGHNAFLNASVTDLYIPEGVESLTIDSIAFGPSASSMTVHIAKGSWCDNNRDAWDIGFSSIIAE